MFNVLWPVIRRFDLSRYDHLAKVLTRLLTDRPADAADIFEDVSRLEKQEKHENKVDTLIDKPDKTAEIKLAEIQKTLFMREGEDEENVPEADDAETPLPNVHETMHFFEQAGVGIGREESVRIFLALKQLVEKYPLDSIRFWGKLFGVEENYYVAEVKFQDGKEEEEEEEEEEKDKKEDDKDENAEENDVSFDDFEVLTNLCSNGPVIL